MNHLQTRARTAATGAPHARDSTSRLSAYALGLAVCVSTPAPAQARATTASHQARPTLTREPTMTQLTTTPLDTVDAPAAAPTRREAAGEDQIRPFRVRVP